MGFDFKGRQAAQNWQNKLNSLNDQANTIMKGASACINEINADSAGGFVDDLVQTGSEMLEATASMLTAFNALSDAITSVISLMANVAEELVGIVAGGKGKMTK